MRKFNSVKLFLTLSLGLILILITFLSLSPKPVASEIDTSSAVYPLYTVKSVGNRIGVFYEGSSDPQYYLDRRLDALPESDRNNLKIGIAVYSDEELSRLIEDMDG